jgi:1-deoxy-D-xylulose-5-phosphate synthase
MAASHDLLVTLEENAIAGGAGSAVAEYLSQQGLLTPLLQLGFADEYVDHDSQKQQLSKQGLDMAGIESAVVQRLALLQSDIRKTLVR